MLILGCVPYADMLPASNRSLILRPATALKLVKEQRKTLDEKADFAVNKFIRPPEYTRKQGIRCN